MSEPRDREWNEKGEYTELYPPEEIYGLIEAAPNQVVTTGDISNELGCTIDSARSKLKELRFDRKIKKRDTGGRVQLWYIPDEEQEDAGETGGSGDSIAGVLADAAPETVLKLLSHQVGDPITVGDTVYEDGDKHPVDTGS